MRYRTCVAAFVLAIALVVVAGVQSTDRASAAGIDPKCQSLLTLLRNSAVMTGRLDFGKMYAVLACVQNSPGPRNAGTSTPPQVQAVASIGSVQASLTAIKLNEPPPPLSFCFNLQDDFTVAGGTWFGLPGIIGAFKSGTYVGVWLGPLLIAGAEQSNVKYFGVGTASTLGCAG